MEGYLHKGNVAGNAESQVNAALLIYALLVVLVTSASWYIYWLTNIFMTRPLYGKNDQFRDLTNYAGKMAHLHGGAAALGSGFPIFNYPASAAYVFAFFLRFGAHAVQAYLAFVLLCVIGFAIVAWCASGAGAPGRLGAAAAIATTALLGYPLWVVADRGNTEIVVWALAAAGLCFLLRGRTRTAAVLIGLSASIKPFSILFLLLLLGRRKYKEAALGLVTAGLEIGRAHV